MKMYDAIDGKDTPEGDGVEQKTVDGSVSEGPAAGEDEEEGNIILSDDKFGDFLFRSDENGLNGHAIRWEMPEGYKDDILKGLIDARNSFMKMSPLSGSYRSNTYFAFVEMAAVFRARATGTPIDNYVPGLFDCISAAYRTTKTNILDRR